jgi:sugar phosphate isomerase/epimerase
MKKLLFLIILFFAAEVSPLFAQKKLYNYPIGMASYTMRKHWATGAEKTLDMLQKMGIEEFEGGAPKGVKVEDFLKMCNDRNIKVIGTGCGFEALEKDPQAIADAAKALGVKYVMCAWIPHKGNDFVFEDAKRAVKAFNAAGKILKQNGITFCYHDHGYEFKPNPEGKGTMMDYIIQNTDKENVSFEMDVLWTLHGGGAKMPETLLKKYPGRWKLMHVKDLKLGTVGDFTGHTPAENDVVVGTGMANWKKIFKLAKKAGVEHAFIEDESEHELENVPLSIEYLKKL